MDPYNEFFQLGTDQAEAATSTQVEETSNLLHLPQDENPMDVVISRHIQNMMATFGPEKVRNSLKELFGIDLKKSA